MLVHATVRAEHAMHIAPRVALSIDGFLVGGFMLACSPAAMGPVTVFADPGKYEYYSCEQIAAQRTYWRGRELEMKLLMDKADQGTGGAVVNVIAYQGDYVVAREQLKGSTRRPVPRIAMRRDGPERAVPPLSCP